MPPAIAMLEFDSIAVGVRTADAMVKRAPLELFRVGTVHPGKYLVLIGGTVAAVEESRSEGLNIGAANILDEMILPSVEPRVVKAIDGHRSAPAGDALGTIETETLPTCIAAADRAVKAANVTLVEMRLGDDLGGKGLFHLSGLLHDVQAAIDAAMAGRSDRAMRSTVVPMQHGELRGAIRHSTSFHAVAKSEIGNRKSEIG